MFICSKHIPMKGLDVLFFKNVHIFKYIFLGTFRYVLKPHYVCRGPYTFKFISPQTARSHILCSLQPLHQVLNVICILLTLTRLLAVWSPLHMPHNSVELKRQKEAAKMWKPRFKENIHDYSSSVVESKLDSHCLTIRRALKHTWQNSLDLPMSLAQRTIYSPTRTW